MSRPISPWCPSTVVVPDSGSGVGRNKHDRTFHRAKSTFPSHLCLDVFTVNPLKDGLNRLSFWV